MSGLRIQTKKNKALRQIREELEDDHYFEAVKPLLERGIDLFVLVGGGTSCSECGEVISSSSTSGLCRKCYQRVRAKTPAGKAKRKRWRLNRKLKVLNEKLCRV